MILLDPAIRDAVVAHLTAAKPSAAVLHEVPIRYARGHFDAGRADVIAVSDVVAGYEIKSDADSLVRLGRQIVAYEALCDFCTIVVGPRHLVHVRAVLPASWGIIVVETSNHGALLRRERPEMRNAAVEPAAIARQLWREECIALLKEHGMRPERRAYVHTLWPLVEALPLDVLRSRLRVALVDHENALRDERAARRERQRGHRQSERERREKRDRMLAEWVARARE